MSFVTLDKLQKGQKAPKAPKPAPAVRTGRSSRTLPTVNLLSPTTLDGMAVTRVRNRFVVGGLVLGLAVGAGWLVRTAELHSAQDRLAAETAMKPALQAQVNALAPVAQFVEGVAARKAMASDAMAGEVLFSEALKDLVKRTPAGMKIGSMSVTLNVNEVLGNAPPASPLDVAGIGQDGKPLPKPGATNPTGTNPTGTNPASTNPAGTNTTDMAPTAFSADTPDPAAALNEGTATAKKPVAKAPAAMVSCARPDPFNPAPIIGCVSLTGTADSRAVVGEFITALKASKMYADPFVTVTTASGTDGDEKVTYSGSVGLTGDAVSGRYVNLDWLSDPSVLRKAEAMIRNGQTASAKWAAQAKRDAAIEKARKEAEEKAKLAAEAAAQAAAEAAAAKQIQEAAQAAAEAAALASGNGGSQ
jgi:hypothetical protein